MKNPDQHADLDEIYRAIARCREETPATSRTARLLARGTTKIAQKVGEEAVEVALVAARGKRKKVIAESADLMYHLLALWADQKIMPAEVWERMARRKGFPGNGD